MIKVINKISLIHGLPSCLNSLLVSDKTEYHSNNLHHLHISMGIIHLLLIISDTFHLLLVSHNHSHSMAVEVEVITKAEAEEDLVEEVALEAAEEDQEESHHL